MKTKEQIIRDFCEGCWLYKLSSRWDFRRCFYACLKNPNQVKQMKRKLREWSRTSRVETFRSYYGDLEG